MIFAELYRRAEALPAPPVGFDFLRGLVTAHHSDIGEVRVYATTYTPPNGQAHYRLGEADRTSGYGQEYQVAEIRYCESLDDDGRELRFALTKELMHVFDTAEERVDTPDKFRRLLHEIQNEPLGRHQSEMYRSELNTRWMALLVLCPKVFRDQYVADYRAGRIADFDIAERFEIPEWTAEALMDDYYDQVYEAFVNGNGNGHQG